jgi:integrase
LKKIGQRPSGFVFTRNKRPPSGFSKAMNRIRSEMRKLAAEEFEGEIERFTIHDLRRSFASHVARLPGVSLATVSLCLNHWSGELGGLREIYVQHDQAAATKAAFKAWADHVAKIVAG